MMIVAASMMTAGSCQMADDEGLTREMTVTVGISDSRGGVSARSSESAESFSHLGGALNVDPAEFDLRYIVEVWSGDENPELVYRNVKSVDSDYENESASFTLNLPTKPCYLVFWADFVKQGKIDDLHYVTEGNLQNVRYSEDITNVGDLAADDMDAYCAVFMVDPEKEYGNEKVILKRPFGKIRMVSTDVIEVGELDPVEPVVATIEYKNVQFPTDYNVLTGRSKTEKDITLSRKFDFKVIKEDVMVKGDEHKGAYLLGYDYLFAADQVPSYTMDITVYGDESKTMLLGTKSISGIPLTVNNLTTVIGNFYTEDARIEVLADDAFDVNE